MHLKRTFLLVKEHTTIDIIVKHVKKYKILLSAQIKHLPAFEKLWYILVHLIQL